MEALLNDQSCDKEAITAAISKIYLQVDYVRAELLNKMLLGFALISFIALISALVLRVTLVEMLHTTVMTPESLSGTMLGMLIASVILVFLRTLYIKHMDYIFLYDVTTTFRAYLLGGFEKKEATLMTIDEIKERWRSNE